MIPDKKPHKKQYARWDERKNELKTHYYRIKRGSCSVLVASFNRNKVRTFDDSSFRRLFEKCCVEHPTISIEPKVLGGIPHIENSRLSVGQVLDRLYVLGSIKAVAKYYAPHITEAQIKDAIAYAQDFMELAGDPYQTYD